MEITDERVAIQSQGRSNCARVGHVTSEDLGQLIAVSNDTDGPLAKPVQSSDGRWLIRFTLDEWRAFIAGVKDGQFDLDDDGRLPALGV